MPAQVCFGSFLMTRARLSQVVPQRQQSGLPLPLHLVEWEELSGCAEKGKAHTGVMQQAAVGLAHSAKPLSRPVSSFAFCTRWLWRRASPGGGKRCLLLLIKALSLLTAPPRGSLTAETVTLESQRTGFYRFVMRKPVQKKDTQQGKEVRVRSRQDYTDAVQTHLFEHAERVLVMQSRLIPNDKLLLLKASARIKSSHKWLIQGCVLRVSFNSWNP